MSYVPEDKDDKKNNKPTTTRIMIWVGVGAVGLYFLVSGIIGIATGGH
ncbi:hypothetical protein [Subtercola frigoramans]|uniref:Uncharacterized protein n=1 Tax=Subtercola frigoramans TaxID=120298 RepID=A0ABS2L251_9MICO|nr:hypothetical protein [Subtercola frigoramans]MBM7471147.1 hypothetical protein [Subtercola frigoramans]